MYLSDSIYLHYICFLQLKFLIIRIISVIKNDQIVNKCGFKYNLQKYILLLVLNGRWVFIILNSQLPRKKKM